HPVAPAPASAFLSGIIVKGGVLAIIRVVYYYVGADFLRGTWVQTAWAVLAVVTLLMGSSLAFKEKILKKRLAYSTVS
ncbi:proton-conducting membrane transporter, partial [Klebsiella oxytoca]